MPRGQALEAYAMATKKHDYKFRVLPGLVDWWRGRHKRREDKLRANYKVWNGQAYSDSAEMRRMRGLV